MSTIDYCLPEASVCCACDQWFKKVRHFVDHARLCDKFQALPEQHKEMYAMLLRLKEGALTA